MKTNGLLHLWYLQKGLQKICVESPGVHELQLSDSCISFASNSIKIDVSNPQVLVRNVCLLSQYVLARPLLSISMLFFL